MKQFLFITLLVSVIFFTTNCKIVQTDLLHLNPDNAQLGLGNLHGNEGKVFVSGSLECMNHPCGNVFFKEFLSENGKLGSEQSLTGYAHGYVESMKMETLTNGNLVFLSIEFRTNDLYQRSVTIKILGADGSVVKARTEVATYTQWEVKFDPSLDVLPMPNGKFVITYTKLNNEKDCKPHLLWFDSEGNQEGNELQYCTDGNLDCKRTQLVKSSEDRVLAVSNTYYNDGQKSSYTGMIWNSDGSEYASIFKITNNTDYGAEDLDEKCVAFRSGGTFFCVIMFKDKDGDTYGIFGQFVNSDGTKQGKEIQVNNITESFQLDPKLLVLTNDNLLVMWNSFYQDGSSCGVYAKIYSKDGSVVKSDFLINVNDTHLGQLLHSGHNIVPNNQFIITWDSSGKQESGNTIVAQILNNDGTFVGSDFIVNKNNKGNQRIKNVLVLDNGKIVFVWECEQEKDYKYVIYNPDTTVYKENKTIVSTKNYENVFLLTPNTLTTVSLPPTSKSTSTPTTKLQPTSPALDTKEDVFNFFIFYQKKAEKTHAKEYKLLGKDGKIIKDWTMVGDFFRAGEFKKIEYQDEMPKTFLLSNNQVTTAYIGEILQPDELTRPNSGNVKHLYNQEHIYGYNLNTKDYSTTEIYHIDDYYKDSDRDSITGCALNDKYVIAYRDKNGNDGDSDGIFGAIFNNKDNSAVKEEFLINGITQGRQYSPKIVRQSGSDENNWGIFYLCEDQNNENAFNLHYRIFDGSGKLIGKTHEMNQNGYGIVDYHFDYINDQENQIFLVYTDNSNKDGDGSGVFGQIIKITDGSKIGKLLSLSKTTKGDQWGIKVACLSDKNLVIVYAIDNGVNLYYYKIIKNDGTIVVDETPLDHTSNDNRNQLEIELISSETFWAVAFIKMRDAPEEGIVLIFDNKGELLKSSTDQGNFAYFQFLKNSEKSVVLALTQDMENHGFRRNIGYIFYDPDTDSNSSYTFSDSFTHSLSLIILMIVFFIFAI